MNHQERLELLGALSRAGVTYYKSHDLEINFDRDKPAPLKGLAAWLPEVDKPAPNEAQVPPEKLNELIDTLKMDDAALLDKIFPAGAGL